MLKKILLTLLLLLAAAIAIVLGLAAGKPDTFRVERSVTIQAPPEKIAPLIENFQNWSTWSPYEKLDPSMKRVFSGAPSGKGAVYAWDGTGNAGAGRMEIVESMPQRIGIRLDFSKPFTAHNMAAFILQAQGAGATQVTWSMEGPAPLVSKIMQVFFSMDTMIGTDFEAGLANLKAAAEKV
ncbi:SRPBCC family protein [Variovorax sp. dw_308]|uniref:SRPBCC family protein n=1 Tax=Variovorax sp. dw_308 TaxID=2721546 RepID=UPI001C45FF31|nr:SRPBCC family protein [Variovorax sp. dw_308]